jgi:integrase/recombinase XerD
MAIKKNIDPLVDLPDITILESAQNYISENITMGILSRTSAYNRTKELERFTKFCAAHDIVEPRDIHKNLVIQYLRTLKVTQGTKNTIIMILSAYMNYLVDQDLVLDNIISSIKVPKTRYPQSDFLTEHEINLVFRKVAETSKKKFVDRNLLLFNLLFQICLRGTEASNLRLKDVRLENGDPQLFVRRKGGKEVDIPLNQDLVEMFNVWLDIRNTFCGAQESPWVFLTSHGTQLNRNQIHDLVRRAILNAGLVKRKMGPHILRHSGATLLSGKGASPQEIQFLLGHESLNSTQKYLHFDSERLRDTVNLMGKRG